MAVILAQPQWLKLTKEVPGNLQCFVIYSPVKKTYNQFMYINSLTPGRCGCNFRKVIFQLLFWIEILSGKIFVMIMPPNSIDDKSTLVQIMAWCHQAPSHYLNQYWPISLMPYGIPRLQKSTTVGLSSCFTKHYNILHILSYFNTDKVQVYESLPAGRLLHSQNHGCFWWSGDTRSLRITK